MSISNNFRVLENIIEDLKERLDEIEAKCAYVSIELEKIILDKKTPKEIKERLEEIEKMLY